VQLAIHDAVLRERVRKKFSRIRLYRGVSSFVGNQSGVTLQPFQTSTCQQRSDVMRREWWCQISN